MTTLKQKMDEVLKSPLTQETRREFYFDDYLLAMQALKEAVEALKFYGESNHWSEEYIGGPRLSFTSEEGEGFEKAKDWLKKWGFGE